MKIPIFYNINILKYACWHYFKFSHQKLAKSMHKSTVSEGDLPICHFEFYPSLNTSNGLFETLSQIAYGDYFTQALLKRYLFIITWLIFLGNLL